MPLHRLKKIFTGQGISQTTGSVYPVWSNTTRNRLGGARRGPNHVWYTCNVGIAASYDLFHGLKETIDNDHLNLPFHISHFMNIHLEKESRV